MRSLFQMAAIGGGGMAAFFGAQPREQLERVHAHLIRWRMDAFLDGSCRGNPQGDEYLGLLAATQTVARLIGGNHGNASNRKN